MIGKNDDEKKIPLLPICHTTQKAQIEIVIDQEGNFRRAKLVDNDDARTIIPCTEKSGGRSGAAPENHPLCDKLQYVAGDFLTYGGTVTSGFSKRPKEPYEKYVETLEKWCSSIYCHLKVAAILKYVRKESMMKDLVEALVLFMGEDGNLEEKWDKKIIKNAQDINQKDAFVRWIVEIPGDQAPATWNDRSLFESWINYYSSLKNTKSLCYVTGEELPIADQHPAKVRNDGDKAKLISANDTNGFTFRGRFTDAEQACCVGFMITQKAHNALRWLISRQGYKKGDQTQAIVAWAISGQEVPDPLQDPFSLMGFDQEATDNIEKAQLLASTAQELAIKLKKKIAGYSTQIDDTTDIVVMGVDSATTGRMAISFYRRLTGSEFLRRVERWHTSCEWIHDYRFREVSNPKTGKKEKIFIRFVGAPAPNDIVEAAYGNRVDDNLQKKTVERILPCIIDGKQIPRDIVLSAIGRAVNRMGMGDFEWNKVLSIACSLYKKYKEEERYEMSLESNRTTRDYLYGRLLALADSIEQWALSKSGEKRQTNAARLMQRFANHPCSTWMTIELSLQPYFARLGGAAWRREQMISEVMALFHPDDFSSDKKLNGEFLLGYHCQREALRNKENREGDDNNQEEIVSIK